MKTKSSGEGKEQNQQTEKVIVVENNSPTWKFNKILKVFDTLIPLLVIQPRVRKIIA